LLATTFLIGADHSKVANATLTGGVIGGQDFPKSVIVCRIDD
jgi:hypothetical protein